MNYVRIPYFSLLLCIVPLMTVACSNADSKSQDFFLSEIKKTGTVSVQKVDTIKPAAHLYEEYLPLLENKRVGLIANQSSTVGEVHLLDFLLRNGVKVSKIFSPEHGFRGNIERGEIFDAHIDQQTGLAIVPMYGNTRKPTKESLEDVDILVFDIQDVGVRFYTYISSMHLAMEAAAENSIPFLVLDRPNPLGDYVSGPVLDLNYRSFVGMHPIPVVHGLTVGELAKMINDEKWLKDGIQCNLTVILCKNYHHTKSWSLPIRPSPNLPNDISVRLYPSLCFFEATEVSIGRGTEFPFQVVGYPDSTLGSFSFIPNDIPGMQTNPIQKGNTCYGLDLRNKSLEVTFTLSYVLQFNEALKKQGVTMISNPRWFNLLAGNNTLIKQIEAGMSEEEIFLSWEDELNEYKAMREKYLLYPDFE